METLKRNEFGLIEKEYEELRIEAEQIIDKLPSLVCSLKTNKQMFLLRPSQFSTILWEDFISYLGLPVF